MVKHIILWTIKEEYTDSIDDIKLGIKEGLEGLKGKYRWTCRHPSDNGWFGVF